MSEANTMHGPDHYSEEFTEHCAEQVRVKVEARKMAGEVFCSGLLKWPDGYGADYADALLATLREMLPKRRVDVVEPEKPEPIARLGSTVIEYGEFRDNSYDDIPLDRLDWYCRKAEENAKSLKAYLTHPDLESRRRGAGD